MTDKQKYPPAYFHSLHVKNIKCFKDATLKLHDPNDENKWAQWTVLLGDNGTGKTTLLQCLSYYEDLAPVNPAFYHNKLHNYDSTIVKNSFTTSLITANIFKCKRNLGCKKFQFNYQIKVEILPFGTNNISVDYNSRGGRDFILFVLGYGASRRSGRTTMTDEIPPHPSETLFDDEVKLLDPEEWLLQTDYAVKSGDKKAEIRFNRVKDAIIGVLPGESTEKEITNLRIEKADEGRRGFKVLFETPFGWVRLKNLSLGYQTMITWIVDLVTNLYEVYPDSENPLAEPAIVLIDEFDLHMHPRWQRELMSYLTERFPNTQFIVTAHSPLVVQAAADQGANIVLLERVGDEVKIRNNPVDVKGWRADQILASDLFPGADSRSVETKKLLEERRKLLLKSRKTAKDKQRINEIERMTPTADSQEEIEMRDFIKKVAYHLKDKEKDIFDKDKQTIDTPA